MRRRMLLAHKPDAPPSENYLRVRPAVIWVSTEMPAIWYVESNADWVAR